MAEMAETTGMATGAPSAAAADLGDVFFGQNRKRKKKMSSNGMDIQFFWSGIPKQIPNELDTYCLLFLKT